MLSEFGRLLKEGDIPVWGMLIMAGFAIAMIWERVRSLFYEYGLKTDEFYAQMRKLILEDKIEEAISYCATFPKAVMPKVIKVILERSDRDDENIHSAQDIATMDIVPMITKRLGYLAMIANVATLMGLLGTIHGLISSFQAVSFADPAQKQILLAQGISQSMNTTALGLFVAIPVMIVYAILQARQNKLIEETVSVSAKVVDLLITRNYQGFSEDAAFPSGDKTTPLPGKAEMPVSKKKVG